jgi:hypothetical protein
MKTTTFASLLLSGVASFALMTPAYALDAEAFLDRIAEVYAKQGIELTFGEAAVDGDTIIVQGLDYAVTGVDDSKIKLDTEFTFSGVAEYDDGSYSAAELSVPDVENSFEDDEGGTVEVSVKDIRLSGLYIAPEGISDVVASLQMFESAGIGPISVKYKGFEFLSIAASNYTAVFTPDQFSDALESATSKVDVEGLKLDLTEFAKEDKDSGKVLEQLGLLQLSGRLSQEGSWNLADGALVGTKNSLSFDNVGALDFAFNITGFTPEVLEQLNEMSMAMAAGGDQSEEAAQAQMMSGMAIMQGVNIVSASVRYDDASFAGKLIEYLAAEQGASRADFVTGLKTMLPMMLAGLEVPALADIIVPAVNSFLDNPQSIEVKVAPPSPTSLLVLMAAAANPAGLVSVLGLAVEANTAR